MFQWSWGQIWPGQLCFNGAGVKILLGSFMFEWSWGLSFPGQLYVSVEQGSKFSWAVLCLNGPRVLVVLGSFMFQWSWGQNCPGQLYVTAGLLGVGSPASPC